jgi:hypothetical protein
MVNKLVSLPQHIWDDEVSYVAASDVHLLEMRHTAVARGYRDVFQLYVHVVLGC